MANDHGAAGEAATPFEEGQVHKGVPENLATRPAAAEGEDLPADAPSDLSRPPKLVTPQHAPTGSLPPSDLSTALCGLAEQITRLEGLFEDKIRYDRGREAIIDRLHAELQEQKSDLVLKLLRPLALELISLHDDLGKLVGGYTGQTESVRTSGVVELLAGLQSSVEAILDRSGFEAFNTDEPAFDAKRQRAVRSVPTDQPALHRTVAERLRKGFAYEGRVVRPELVSVHICDRPGGA